MVPPPTAISTIATQSGRFIRWKKGHVHALTSTTKKRQFWQ
jgi:hypothetical protein